MARLATLRVQGGAVAGVLASLCARRSGGEKKHSEERDEDGAEHETSRDACDYTAPSVEAPDPCHHWTRRRGWDRWRRGSAQALVVINARRNDGFLWRWIQSRDRRCFKGSR